MDVDNYQYHTCDFLFFLGRLSLMMDGWMNRYGYGHEYGYGYKGYVAYACLFLCAYVDNSIHENTHRYDCIFINQLRSIDSIDLS